MKNWKLWAVIGAGAVATYWVYRVHRAYAWIVAAVALVAAWWVHKNG